MKIALPGAWACVALAVVTACGGQRGAAGSDFKPVRPNVLTVATAFIPAPGFWQGPGARGGIEAGLAAELAKRLGLARVQVKQLSFRAIVSGHLRGVDLALSQLTPTSAREKVVDFSTPYLHAPPGVLALKGVEGRDIHDLQQLHWVVSSLSTLTPVVEDRVRPTDPPVVVDDRTQALAVLRGGGAEALMLDLPVALGLAAAEPFRFHVLGQLTGEAGLAAAFPKGSPNVEIVDSEIRALEADGTIDKLVERWLHTSVDDVPLILSEDR
jgi:polar amino acid transport system substrate-binding protein